MHYASNEFEYMFSATVPLQLLPFPPVRNDRLIRHHQLLPFFNADFFGICVSTMRLSWRLTSFQKERNAPDVFQTHFIPLPDRAFAFSARAR